MKITDIRAIESEIKRTENIQTALKNDLAAISKRARAGGSLPTMLYLVGKKIHLTRKLKRAEMALAVFTEGLEEKVNERICERVGDKTWKQKNYPGIEVK